MAVSADDLVVFAGAGLSRSTPANLPTFDALRDEILTQLKLERYTSDRAKGGPRDVASALAPELFMLALSQARLDVESWLTEVLSGARPNAAHHAVAQLAAAGGRVWTVNFDKLIEEVPGPVLRTVAWGQDPPPNAQLLKPHGSVGGKLIVTARQVIEELGSQWEERLRSDVRGRTVLFVGYRGRDLDFRPIWDKVLCEAAAVIWFDIWTGGAMDEAEEKKKLLAQVEARGKLTLAPPAPLPAGAPASGTNNPSWDFISWCQDRGLVTVEPGMISLLFDDPASSVGGYPALDGDKLEATAAVQGMLGDYAGVRATYWRALRRPGYQRAAAFGLSNSYLMHGGNGVAAVLSAAAALPPYGRIGKVRERALRMRLSAWSRTGRQRSVLRATRKWPPGAVSVYPIQRSVALRITGSLDEAARTAAEARAMAKTEKHVVRLANATFQEALALLWAGRLSEARACLDDHLKEYARLAGNRWTAWAAFAEAGWHVHSGQAENALAQYDAAEMRFRAEGLFDGVMSVETARLVAYRLTGEYGKYEETLKKIENYSRDGERGARYYTRGNDFTVATIMNDRAEHARSGLRDLDTARDLYKQTAASRYPLQSTLGHLGLALIQAGRGQSPGHARTALATAERIGFQFAAARARALLGKPLPLGALDEVYFV